MTLRGVRKLLEQLATRGHLVITKPAIKGRGHVDRCRWNIKKGNDSSSFNGRKRGTTVPLLATGKEEPPFPKKRNHRSAGSPLMNPFERIPLSDDAMLILMGTPAAHARNKSNQIRTLRIEKSPS
jgi:hypothetical protein